VIQCSNPHCRALASSLVSRCPTCQTPLQYRFLLAVSAGQPDFTPGTLVADRYWVWSSDIWLDTQPEAAVVPLETLPPFLVPYLRLSTLPQHMPRPFALLSLDDSTVPEPILLLDAAPIGSRITQTDQVEPFLLPSLAAAWAEGSALRQINWLRQVARLWSPLVQEGVATTLLQLDGLRVDQALLRLSGLTSDPPGQEGVTLTNLGQQWRLLLPKAQSQVAPYLGWLVETLIDQELSSADDLVAELDQAVQQLAQGLSLELDWVAYTDQGPERPRNEDACYPEGQVHQLQLGGEQAGHMPLLVVCDGIGGHEQGNVASQTAIKVLVDALQPLAQHPDPSPQLVAEHLYQALARANDAIADRNNIEQRAARARMGTTVVLALVHFPYLSIAHLGDSRAYRISDRTCYQITLDDDIASRETRLGYTLYPEALQIPNGGALIQALGIADSGQLYPTVQHLLIDDAAVLLLCSDGLSDYDRVDLLWRHSLTPLGLSPSNLASAGQGLIDQANRLNGHDNVTVGLLRLTPGTSTYSPLPAHRLRPLISTLTPAEAAPAATSLGAPGAASEQVTQAPAAAKKSLWSWPLLLGERL
jgi:serine/threonine protein phosphatase PrpC